MKNVKLTPEQRIKRLKNKIAKSSDLKAIRLYEKLITQIKKSTNERKTN